MKKTTPFIFYLLVLFLFSGCATYLNQPIDQTRARIGENTSVPSSIKNYLPQEKVLVGVYKFRDLTGQYKPLQNGSTFSTAVSQGGTSILLKSLEDSNWFRPIERENIGNLLNERQIIRNTRQEYAGNSQPQKLPPLLFAGVIIEGGVVSYDSNIITGGSGLRYFGVGASNEYREDRITVYLRVVSTSTGEILKNVYASKTILSQGISANLYRFVSLRRLLEAETGVTKNEPSQLALKEAIDKAVEMLIAEGVISGLWSPQGGKPVANIIKKDYEKEVAEAESIKLFNRKQELRRGPNSMSAYGGLSRIVGDYANAAFAFGFDLKFKHLFKDPRFAFSAGVGRFEIENTNIFRQAYLTSNLNAEYNILPYDRLSPFVFAGAGTVSTTNLKSNFFKFQYGFGLEYLITNNWGIIVHGEHNLIMSDYVDTVKQGTQNDQVWNIRAGLNFYF